MFKIDGMDELKKLRRKVGRLDRQIVKIEANAVNATARRVRRVVNKSLSQRTGISSRYIGRRIFLRRANPRKRKLDAKVKTYVQKFSASYRDKRKGGALVARRAGKRGVRLGRVMFPGAFIARSSRYNREFVGARRGKNRNSIYYPAVNLEPQAKSILSAAERMEARYLEREMAKRIERLFERGL